MPYLKFYSVENQIFAKESAYFFTDKHAEKICRKLAKHFKFTVGKIRFRKLPSCYGRATYDDSSISFMHGPSILTICHELAHLFQYQKIGKSYHGKKLLTIIRRFLAYCESKGWWISESVIDQRMIERAPLCFADKQSGDENK